MALLALISCVAAAGAAHPDETAPSEVEEALDGFEDAEEPTEPEDGELDDVFGGFEDEDLPPPEEAPPEAKKNEAFWRLGGSFEFGTSINILSHESTSGTRYGGLSRLRPEFALDLEIDLPRDWGMRFEAEVDYDFAYLARGREQYTPRVLDVYEFTWELRDAYLEGSFGDSFDLKLGRQIVNWGRSDSLRVVDVINPLDLREPGLVDLDDLRLGVTMARFDYYYRAFSAQLLVIPELRFSREPVFGSDFFPLFFDPDDLALDDTPDRWGEDPQIGFALTGVFSGWDVSAYTGWFYQDSPFVELVRGTPVSRHSRYVMVGGGGNYTVGGWLFKAELAYLDGLRQASGEQNNRIDVLVGIEYYGFRDTQLALEIVNRHTFGFESAFASFPGFANENDVQVALRYTGDFVDSRLHVTALALLFGIIAEDGSVLRFSADYDLRDALTVGGGIALYQGGDRPPFSDVEVGGIPIARSIARNDRIFLHVRYSF